MLVLQLGSSPEVEESGELLHEQHAVGTRALPGCSLEWKKSAGLDKIVFVFIFKAEAAPPRGNTGLFKRATRAVAR